MTQQKTTTANALHEHFGGPPVSQLQAIWLDGHVPKGYWDSLEHQRLYVRWLGQKLGFCKPEDWYRLTTEHFKRNHGGGLLALRFRDSAVAAVKQCFPDCDWKEWLFGMTPLRFWKDPKNHRRYMQWLGRQLGIRRPSDWYRVSNQDFKDHKGGAFMLHYDSTVSLAIMRNFPNYDWKEWMFDKTPKGFWHKKKNRKQYMAWLGQKLGFKSIDDWYSLTGNDFYANYGNQLLKFYHGSPAAAVRDCLPRSAWNEWMFARVPVGFWDDPANRKRYLRWLAKKLKFRRPKDWVRVRQHNFLENCGGGLLVRYHSHVKLVKEYVPGFKHRQSRAPR